MTKYIVEVEVGADDDTACDYIENALREHGGQFMPGDPRFTLRHNIESIVVKRKVGGRLSTLSEFHRD